MSNDHSPHPTKNIVYLNGEFLPVEQARVSVLDRGFLFGDGVYEVIPVYGGHLFRLPQHLHRLHHSLTGIRLANPLSEQEWRTILEQLVQRHGGGDLSVYLQITRGAADSRDHSFPTGVEPTVFIMAGPLHTPPQALREQGIECITVEDIRWHWCHIKAITLLPAVLMRQQALDQGAQEALLVRDGLVTEGAITNLFMVKDGTILTPPANHLLLPGITRDLILELAAGHGVPALETEITTAELQAADEVWISGSTKEVLAVTRLDGFPVGDGRPGPLYRRMAELYADYKHTLQTRPE